MNRFLSILFALLCSPALAQTGTPIKQSGNVTPGHAGCWTTNGILQDCGTAVNGFLTSLGVVAQGSGICQSTASPTAPGYQRICLGATDAGGATITVQNFGTDTAQNLNFIINGTIYQFPFNAGGTVGPNTTVTGDFACWNNTVGTLLSDCGGGSTTRATGYTIQTTDNNSLLIANSSSAVTWTLPIFSHFQFKAINIGAGPLFIVPSGSTTINGFAQHELSQLQSASISSDGTNYWSDDQIAGNVAAWNARQIFTFDTVTQGPILTLSGTVTTGDTVGFNFTSTSPSFNLSFRYTYLAGDTLGTAANALITAFKANATVIANLGNVSKYANAHQASTGWILGFDSLYPFSATSEQVFTAFASGGATSGITPASISASNSLEATDFLGFGRSAIYSGRAPAVGDAQGAIFFCADVTGIQCPQDSFQPIVGTIRSDALNVTPGSAASRMSFIADTINLGTNGNWGNGHGVGINTPAPDSPLTVQPPDGNAVQGAAAISGTFLHVLGDYGNQAQIQIDAQSSGGNVAAGVFGRSARGTLGSLSASQSGDILTFLAGAGYGATGYSSGAGQYRCIAAQNFTDTAQGTRCSVWTTPNGNVPSGHLAEVARFDQNLNSIFFGNVGVVNSSPKTFLDINANTSTSPALVNATSVARIQNVDAAVTTLELVSYGSAGVSWIGAASGGTAASPAATTANTSLTNFGGYGYSGSGFALGGSMVISAPSLWSGSNQETDIVWSVTPNGSNTRTTNAMVLHSSSGLSVGASAADPGANALLLKPQAFGSLTTCTSTIEGAIAEVNNSNTTTWGATIAAGGTSKVMAHCNGTNWTVMGD